MAMPSFTMRQLLEAGVHFGHHTRRWNPKMGTFIFGVRNNVHIIDLQQTVPLLQRSLEAVRDVVAGGGRVLFVGTKRQASSLIRESFDRCGQFYVDHRWLGGMLTNWRTITNSISRLKELDAQLNSEESLGLTKKERLKLTRERDKLDRALGGIKEMSAPPNIIVIIDTNKEAIAVKEAQKLSIPVVGVIDSNSDPDGIDFPIPGNDDSLRAIELYLELLWAAVLDGLQKEALASGTDIGAAEEAPVEPLDSAVAPDAPETPTKAEPAPVAGAEAAAAGGADAAATPTTPATPAAEAAPAAEATPAAPATPVTPKAATSAPADSAPAKQAAASEPAVGKADGPAPEAAADQKADQKKEGADA